jgi:hypothetical protein
MGEHLPRGAIGADRLDGARNLRTGGNGESQEHERAERRSDRLHAQFLPLCFFSFEPRPGLRRGQHASQVPLAWDVLVNA